MSATLLPKRRTLSNQEAVATWKLRRKRLVPSRSSAEEQLLWESVAAGTIRSRTLTYRLVTCKVRPMVGSMLTLFWTDPLAIIPAPHFCDYLYGNPASLRAIRQTVFRVNRVFEQVDCPIFACCQASHIFLRPRVRLFPRKTTVS